MWVRKRNDKALIYIFIIVLLVTWKLKEPNGRVATWAWWPRPVILALKMLREEDQG